MITVILYRNEKLLDKAEAEDPESALVAARTLWDEGFNGIQGSKRRLFFYVDDKLVKMVEGRP